MTTKNRIGHLCFFSRVVCSFVGWKELTVAIKVDADIVILLDDGCGVV